MQPYKITITAEWDPDTGLQVIGKMQKINERVTHYEELAEIRKNQHHAITVGHKIKHAVTDLIEDIK